MASRYMSMACSPHGVHMVHSWLTHGHQDRAIYHQHRPYIYSINRIAIHQRLLLVILMRFSLVRLLSALLTILVSGCHNIEYMKELNRVLVSELKTMDLVYFIFLSHFHLFLYLELRVRVIALCHSHSHISHITYHIFFFFF